MATQIRFRRGTTAQHATFTGAAGEVTVDTDKKTLVVHDGVTPGGQPLPTTTTNIPSDNSVSTVKIQNNAVTTAKIADANVTTAKVADGNITWVKLGSDIFNGARKIANAWFTSTFRLWDTTDQTKGLGFVLSAITTGTTRLITVPDRDVDLSLVERGRFVSSDQTITSAALITVAHGLGARPEDIEIDLVCVTAEAGWSIGDIIQNVSDINTITSTNITNARYADATNVYYRFSSASAAFNIPNKSTGATTTITNANWRIRIRAIRY